MHEQLQTYLESLYKKYATDKSALYGTDNQIYGEVYYYSFLKILNKLKLSQDDVFLDIGSGLGKVALQALFTTSAKTIYAIEIQKTRYKQSKRIIDTIQNDIPEIFYPARIISIINDDFLNLNLKDITAAYSCSTAFNEELLNKIGSKINSMKNLKIFASMRKIPNLIKLQLDEIIHVECSWDTVACHIYKDPTKS